MVASPFGFAEIENQADGYIVLKTTVRPNGYTGVTIGIASTLVAITLLVVVVGLLALHKNGKITLPLLP